MRGPLFECSFSEFLLIYRLNSHSIRWNGGLLLRVLIQATDKYDSKGRELHVILSGFLRQTFTTLFFLESTSTSTSNRTVGFFLPLVSDMAPVSSSFLSKVGTLWFDSDSSSGESVRPWSVLRTTTFAILTSMGYHLFTKIGFALTLVRSPISTLWRPNAMLLASGRELKLHVNDNGIGFQS